MHCVFCGKMVFCKMKQQKEISTHARKNKEPKSNQTKTETKKSRKNEAFCMCSVQCDVFIYWFEHFVSLSDGIYRNQHRYTCWYIFILMSITKRWTKVRHKCSITMSKCTANDNSAHQSTSNRILVPLQRFTVNWKHITVGWPTHVCHATKWFQCV